MLPVQWIASFGSSEPDSPHVLWQFSPAYDVPGVGVTDCNQFNGTMAQLAAHGWHGV